MNSFHIGRIRRRPTRPVSRRASEREPAVRSTGLFGGDKIARSISGGLVGASLH
jgi:hypothetical protein